MEFYQPWMLTTLVFVPLVYLVFLRRKRPSVVVSSIRPAAQIRSRRRRTVFEITLLIALILFSLALARPRKAVGERKLRSRGLDIVLALDMSGSMEAIDRPENSDDESFINGINSKTILNRIESAKREIRNFILARPNDRIGLIGFADMAYSFVPPTLDHGLLLARLASLQAGEIGERTGIASPVGNGVSRLKKSDAPRRVLVLFTDGTNTAENPLTPEEAAKVAREFNVIIHTVGIGSNDSYIIDPFFNRLRKAEGQYDSALLKKLSDITGGSFFAAADTDGLRRTMEAINKLEKTNIEQPRPAEYYEYAPLLAIIALAVLLTGISAECIKIRLP